MIPILYAAAETDFTHNGIGALRDASKCVVTEERNGGFVLELEYPVSGAMYEYIQEDCIIKAKPNDTANNQLFRIYSSSKPKSGFVTFLAEHISYELSGNPIESVSFSNRSAVGALNAVLDAALLPHDYKAQSDIETLNSTALSRVSVRAALGGVKGSILDTYGGEYEFDNFIIKLHAHRGSNTGIKIAYGKNITDIKQEKNISAVYTAVYPYARYTLKAEEGSEEQPEEVVVTISEKILYSTYASNYARVKVYMKDFTDAFGDGEAITEEKLRAKAQSWVNTSGFDVPSVNITVSFINLWQTPEYAKYAILERVNLCDTVAVEYSELGITAEAKVIKTKYDALKEKYISLELGNARANFADTVNQTTAGVEAAKSEIKKQTTAVSIKFAQAIAKATAAITGQSGGYVVLNPSENPQEILIMDTPDIRTAVNVWRWNAGGLGHSSNGYNGPFELAMTADGAINANFITAGELNGIILKAGSVEANAISAAYKKTVTAEIGKSAKTIEQKFKAADGELLSSIGKTFESYSTTEQMNSAISQTAESITAEVNKKVNDKDFGTKIVQNYKSVQIAWNDISKYIEFSGGAMNIYQSTAQGLSNLLMKMNYSGAWYYYNGATIGKIGTNSWSGDNTFRGLVFDLEYGADYMCWSREESLGAGSYEVQLIYYANGKKAKQGLHFSCDTYCWNNLRINENVRTVNWSSGAGGLYSDTHEVGIYGKTAKVKGGCGFECGEKRFSFWNSVDRIVDCYNNIDMHNYDILNQSDARLKTNIQTSEINALSIINSIELKSYDWIESGEHEEVGIIAQQLQKIAPDLVNEDMQTGRLSIKPNKFIPYLIKAIQELSASSVAKMRTATITEACSDDMTLFETEAWSDDMTLSEKMAFIERSKILPAPQPEEIKQEKIQIPIKKGVVENG